jgi:hypothetical protein
MFVEQEPLEQSALELHVFPPVLCPIHVLIVEVEVSRPQPPLAQSLSLVQSSPPLAKQLLPEHVLLLQSGLESQVALNIPGSPQRPLIHAPDMQAESWVQVWPFKVLQTPPVQLLLIQSEFVLHEPPDPWGAWQAQVVKPPFNVQIQAPLAQSGSLPHEDPFGDLHTPAAHAPVVQSALELHGPPLATGIPQ